MRSLVLPTLAVALSLATGCRPAPPKPVAEPAAVSVRTAVAEVSYAPALVPVSGFVRAGRQGLISAQVMGDVIEIPARLGVPVAAGDVLVKLSSKELVARLAQAQATASEVERAFAQESRLLEKGASTRTAVADLKDRFAAAQAAVVAAQAAVDHLMVRAPFAGVVSSKHVDVGDLAAPGRPLLEIHSADGLEIEAGIPAAYATLPLGSEVLIEAAGQQGRARLKELSTSADARTSDRRALFTLPSATIPAGSAVTVRWPGEARQRVLIPAEALRRHGQLERVWVVADGHLQLRLVRVAGAEGGKLEVVSGLQGGESLVLSPADDLTEGARVLAK